MRRGLVRSDVRSCSISAVSSTTDRAGLEWAEASSREQEVNILYTVLYEHVYMYMYMYMSYNYISTHMYSTWLYRLYERCFALAYYCVVHCICDSGPCHVHCTCTCTCSSVAEHSSREQSVVGSSPT